MASKVIRLGNSTGISVPKTELAKLGLKVGDSVTVKKAAGGVAVSKKPAERSADDIAVKLIERYRPALEALSKR